MRKQKVINSGGTWISIICCQNSVVMLSKDIKQLHPTEKRLQLKHSKDSNRYRLGK